MINDPLERFDPEPEGLLRQISQHIDDEMLTEISRADYGEDAEQHLIALRMIRDTGRFPLPMHWYPAEVLELIRWSEPENPIWKPGRAGEFGHWMRAFCSAALLRATREPWSYLGDANDSTVVQLTVSLCSLPVDLAADAVKFLAWLLLHPDSEKRKENLCPYAVCLLWFSLHPPSSLPEMSLIELASWVVQKAKELYVGPPGGNRGLREMVVTSLCAPSWEMLALHFLHLNIGSNDLRVRIRTIADEMLAA